MEFTQKQFHATMKKKQIDFKEKRKNAEQPEKNRVIVKFDIESETAKSLYRLHKDALQIAGLHASLCKDASTTMALDFDIADCIVEKDARTTYENVFKRAFLVADAIQSIVQRKSVKRDNALMLQMLENLKDLRVLAKKVEFEELTGEQLIRLGIADKFLLKSGFVGRWQQFKNWLFGKKTEYRYVFMEREVQREKTYVAHTSRPLPEPVEANHENELRLRFEYGEQLHAGGGIQLAVSYHNAIMQLFAQQQAQTENDAPENISDN